jgi:two-component system response regulator PilR (NtrC family)
MSEVMGKILVVDNEKHMRDLLSIALARGGYDVAVAEDGEVALTMLSSDIFDLMLTDLKMPKMDGVALLKAARLASPETAAVVMTAFASTETAVDAMKQGAYDYLTKPFHVDEVNIVIHNVLERRRLSRENRQLRRELKSQADFSGIIGQSAAWIKVLDRVKKIANSRSNVLITGESGTGKEVIARAIHFNSDRRDRAFVTVNCSALPEPLLESELFGHMRGSFTGAIENKEGLFETAHTGSLFLDEVGETSPAIQAKLLRALQEKEIRRVGGTKDIKVDIRMIAATNQSLPGMVEAGTFREDLYYRLDVIPVHLPPLRERRDDIPLLAAYFVKRLSQELGKNVTAVDAEAMQFLMNREWRGNVREFSNVLERVIAMSSQPILTLDDFRDVLPNATSSLLPSVSSLPKDGLDLEELMDNLEKDLLLKAMERAHGVKTEAARLLGIDFRSFRYRFGKYALKKPKRPAESPAAACPDNLPLQ